MDNNGQQLTTIDNNWQQLTTMDNNGQQCISMDNNGQQWITMDKNPRCYMHLWCRFWYKKRIKEVIQSCTWSIEWKSCQTWWESEWWPLASHWLFLEQSRTLRPTITMWAGLPWLRSISEHHHCFWWEQEMKVLYKWTGVERGSLMCKMQEWKQSIYSWGQQKVTRVICSQ